jgi:hypothetical protein
MANVAGTYFRAGSLYSAVVNPAEATYFEASSLYSAVVNPAEATYFCPSVVTITTATNIRYYQRVWSTGGTVWCYYNTLNALDAAPLSAATTPNWITSATSPEVVAALPEP